MTAPDAKETLRRYLQVAREAMVWKLDGLSEYDARRPLVPTGTNLLGLVKHLAGVEAGYFGTCFDRPVPEPLPGWEDEAEANADMWATVDESREDVVGRYRRTWAHTQATVDALPLTVVGRVPWWPADGAEVTLHRLLLHVVAETHRHAGHADLVREMLDGQAGLRAGGSNLPDVDEQWWAGYRERVEQAARDASG